MRQIKGKYKGVKILQVTDMHLRDEDTSTTKAMLQNNRKIFEELLKVIKEDANIALVVFGGDIQDKTPHDLYEMSVWNEYFTQIGLIMNSRVNKLKNLQVEGYPNILEDIEQNKVMFLPSARGNHDNNHRLKRNSLEDGNEDVERETHTYFDSLLLDKKIINPKWLKFNDGRQDIFIDIRNYGSAGRELPVEAEGCYTIAVFHDNIVDAESNYWQKQDAKAYEASDVLKGVDLGLVNHIHKPLEPREIEDLDWHPIMWQIGSIARMKFNDDEYRDEGYSAIYDTGLNKLEVVKLDLIPKDDYFNIKKALKARKQRKDYSDLKLKYEEVEVSDKSPIEVLEQSKRITNDDIRKLAVKIMKSVLDS